MNNFARAIITVAVLTTVAPVLAQAQITSAFERCIDDRTPVIVTVSGAPGIGKTRLRREAISRIGSHPSASRIVLARCETFGKGHALGLVADVVRGLSWALDLPRSANKDEGIRLVRREDGYHLHAGSQPPIALGTRLSRKGIRQLRALVAHL